LANGTFEHQLKRYSAYFRGWCQAFGEHESIEREESGVHWVFADHQVGLVLPKPRVRQLNREVLLHRQAPLLNFSRDGAQVGSFLLPLEAGHRKATLRALRNVFEEQEMAHVYLSSHLLYSGSRIITFSSRKPLLIIYKEIGTMRVRIEF